jgi:hypothetical protein
MYRSSESESYTTDYLAWPDTISRRCNICGKILEFAHADNGKLVHTLNGPIHQVVYKYTCPNEKCGNWKKYLNPAPRYDYDFNYYGKDVLQRISREIFVFEQNPNQIHKRLTLDYGLDSLRTVQRMYNDCIFLKSKSIDKNTEKRLKESNGLLIAADGQDPGKGLEAIWLFTDCISGRVLKTVQTSTMPAEAIKENVNEILEAYELPLLGFVSDKQNNLVRCLKEFFPNIPHQYCTFHFAGHLWDNLEVFDNQIYSHLKSTIAKLHIHKSSASKMISFGELGKLTVKEVFKGIDDDLQRMLKYQTRKFKSLRGIALFRTLKRYIQELEENMSKIQDNLKIKEHYIKTENALKKALKEVQESFFEDLFMYDIFKVIYNLLYIPHLVKMERQQHLDELFGKVWAIAKIKSPDLILDNLKAFNPKASSTCSVILGEWCRLWNSYLEGLFSYYEFPISHRTNIPQEQAFSVEKGKLTRRMANKEVGLMQELQGEFYLRFCHCTSEEREKDILDNYTRVEMQTLREAYHQKVSKIALKWFYRAEKLPGIDIFLKNYEFLLNNKQMTCKSSKRKKSLKMIASTKQRLKKQD